MRQRGRSRSVDLVPWCGATFFGSPAEAVKAVFLKLYATIDPGYVPPSVSLSKKQQGTGVLT